MSEFYDNYRKRIEEGASNLSAPDKEINQTILWLKSFAIEKLSSYDINNCFTFKAKEAESKKHPNVTPDTFGFTEQMVNHLMTYAFKAGVKSVKEDYEKSTKHMDESLKDIYKIIDDLGYNEKDEW